MKEPPDSTRIKLTVMFIGLASNTREPPLLTMIDLNRGVELLIKVGLSTTTAPFNKLAFGRDWKLVNPATSQGHAKAM